MSDATILALDASSTTIGYCAYWHGTVINHGEITLHSTDIAERCRQAHTALHVILATLNVDVIAIEAPASRFKKSLIPQCRVSGALMAAAALKRLMVVEVSPAAAKLALAGKGTASKDTMQARARAYGVSGEHASDALGVAIAAAGKVEVEHAA